MCAVFWWVVREEMREEGVVRNACVHVDFDDERMAGKSNGFATCTEMIG